MLESFYLISRWRFAWNSTYELGTVQILHEKSFVENIMEKFGKPHS